MGELKVNIGFDVDGVCVDIDLGIIRLIDYAREEDREDLKKFYYVQRKNLLNPLDFLIDGKDGLFFITGREKSLYDVTLKWIKKYYPRGIPVFVDTGHLEVGQSLDEWDEMQAKRKAIAIKKFKIDVFFDDNQDLVLKLRELCPDCKCICYGGRPTIE